MRKSIISICLIVILSIVSISSFALNERKTGFLKSNNRQSSKQKEAASQIERIILDAWTDIEDTFNIDINNYYVVRASDFKGISNYFEEEEGTYIFLNIVSPILSKVPQGSIVPVLYIRHDKKEMLFCYKEADGTNIMKKINLNKINLDKHQKINTNYHESKEVKGKAPMKLDKQKIKGK